MSILSADNSLRVSDSVLYRHYHYIKIPFVLENQLIIPMFSKGDPVFGENSLIDIYSYSI